MLYNVLDNRFTHFDKSLKPTEISEPFYLSVLYNDDDDLSYDYEELLESIVEQFSSELQGFRHHHIRFLSNPPSKVEKEINNFTQNASQFTNFIQTKALELNTALYQGREASFIISQRRENLIKSDFNKKSNNENESDSSSESSHKSEYSYSDSDDSDEDMFIDKFIIYDNEESDEIIKQLDKIAVLINKVFSNAKDKNASLLHGSLASSRNGSKSPSSSSKTTRITKSMKSSISSTMKKNILAQVNCIEDALSSTYLQLFASMKGTLVALIRSADYEQAGNVNREMRQRILEFVGHLNDIKKRASQNLDVKSVRAVDERINQLKSMESEDIKICILDSLRDVIDMTITNYDRNIKKINDEYHDYIQLLKSELGQNSQDVMEKDHIPALIKIEKEKMMALKREEKRSDPSFPEKRNAIRMLIENEQYDTADKETAQLEKLVIKTRKQRIEKVEQKYDLMKQQKIESQREELLMMEKRFSRKVQLAKENKKTAIESRFKILQSSIRSTSQRHLTFALREAFF
ncbi:hypothetical protein TRFO_32188 [Tritrichomonas foetus]|uniref:Uncharacterized protein n=1 Tax=Tritrichomonas foetus TaxID=1144522 RepID=A0A1J4JPL6_9EUKA|nr:hypothetical protein TRFO_32188 [Tritrichomonas foetus]|eukprot:OHT00971.1 hypothetical protein TRFO_32188 [Tritrichomonas foetus]